MSSVRTTPRADPMKRELIAILHRKFEELVHKEIQTGTEFWLARDLQQVLGYQRWSNFTRVIEKATKSCRLAGYEPSDHFLPIDKIDDVGATPSRQVADYALTRYACYLIAQNGDPKKQEIAFAQTYFAIQARRAELIEQRLLEAERVTARKKLTATEKELSQVIYEQTGGSQDFGVIRSKGDHALFNKSTQAMKAQWKVPDHRPLADFAPTIILKAKDFATEITIFNSRERVLASESAISVEHITNNEAVRKTLLERGIRPERLPAAEDVKKVERRLTAEKKKSLQNPDPLDS